MAGKFPVPAAPSVYTARYEHFKGCDFKSDQMSIDPCRFPYAQNLTLDTNGFPEKRPGFREVLSDLGGAVSSLFRGVVSDTVFLFIHAGNTVSARQIDGGTIASNPAASLENIQSCVFYAGVGCVYCMGRKTDENGFCFVFRKKDDGSFGFLDACGDAYVPTVTAAREPGMKNGAALEPVNLLGKKKKVSFLAEDSALTLERIVNNNAFGYETPLVLHLNEKSEDLSLGIWKEIALRYYYSGNLNDLTIIGDSTVEKEWAQVYGDRGKAEFENWRKQYYNKESNHSAYRMLNALYNWLGNGEADSSISLAVLQDDTKFGSVKKRTLPVIVNYGNRGGVYNVWSLCCMISNIFEDPDSVSFTIYLAKHALSYDADDKVKAWRSFEPLTGIGDNIEISYSITDKVHQENLKKITGTRAAVPFGVNGAADRIFIPGVGDEKNYVRFCEMDNPLYWPDLNYVIAGNGNTGVSALFPIGSYLCIAKETNGQDVNLFLLEGTMQNGEAAFLIKEGIAGTGMIAPSAFAHVEDEPHFLAENGVFSLASSDITARKTVVNRSYFLDPRLTIEQGKEKAVMVYWNFLLLLAFPDSGNVYVFNTRDKTYYEKAGSDHFIYEGWLWTSIPAVCFFKDGEHLYFGTQDGRLMKFNTDLEGTERFSDAGGKAIDAYFKTKAFDDGSFMTLKNMRKRGCGALLKPFVRSSCEIYVITDQSEQHLKDLSADIFNWEYIDFTRFEFSANPAIRIKPFNTKVKKYATIQFLVRNREVGESFGVIGIEKAYTMGNYKKN